MNYYKLSSNAIFAIKQPMTQTLELLLELEDAPPTTEIPEYPMNKLTELQFEIEGEEIVPKQPFNLVLCNPPPVCCRLSTSFINHLSQLMNYCLLTQTNINDVMKQMKFFIDSFYELSLTEEYFDWFDSVVQKRNELGILGMKDNLNKAAVEVVSVVRTTDNEKN